MKITPIRAAILAALAVAAIVAYVLHPSSLSVHKTEPAIVRTADPAKPPIPLRLRPRPLVYVAGAVMHPGVYDVAGDARARDAVAKAGGATADADLVAVNLAAHVADGDEIAVPRRGDPRPTRSAAHRAARTGGAHRRRRPRRDASTDVAPLAAQTSSLVNINSAAEDELGALPGIGPAIAERIVEFRALNGPFESIDGLADVAGITPAHLDELESLVTVGR